MKPIPTNLLKRYLAGDFRLPAGAIPLVEIHDGWVICQTAHGIATCATSRSSS